MNFNVLHDGDYWKEFRKHWTEDPNGLFFDVDNCIAADVKKMNTEQGIYTLTYCCFHGKPMEENMGEIVIDSHSVYNAVKHGYNVVILHRWWDGLDGAELERNSYMIKIET